jgi:hypothetical protein
MKPAHIEVMGRSLFYLVVIVISVIFLLFFPIVFDLDAHLDVNQKKCAFAIFLYKKIKIFGGYAETYRGGIALHVSPKKAILLPYKEMNDHRKKFSFIKTFRLSELTITTETGAEYLLFVSILHTILRIYFFLIGGDKKNIENNLWLTDGDVLRVSLNVTMFFNGYILLINFLHFLKEKLQILWQKKKKRSII